MEFYIDTSIWLDLYEDRKGYNNEPLGVYATRFFAYTHSHHHTLVISDMLLQELKRAFSNEQITGLLLPFGKHLHTIISTKTQRQYAQELAHTRSVPFGDALHAILAQASKSILITRDKHFRKLKDICHPIKPEELTLI